MVALVLFLVPPRFDDGFDQSAMMEPFREDAGVGGLDTTPSADSRLVAPGPSSIAPAASPLPSSLVASPFPGFPAAVPESE